MGLILKRYFKLRTRHLHVLSFCVKIRVPEQKCLRALFVSEG